MQTKKQTSTKQQQGAILLHLYISKSAANIAILLQPAMLFVENFYKTNKQKGMKVSIKDIIQIKAGETKAFPCENAKAMFSACSLVFHVKKCCRPAGIANYETKKDYDSNIVLVRAIAE